MEIKVGSVCRFSFQDLTTNSPYFWRIKLLLQGNEINYTPKLPFRYV